jgi:hypothetical protein
MGLPRRLRAIRGRCHDCSRFPILLANAPQRAPQIDLDDEGGPIVLALDQDDDDEAPPRPGVPDAPPPPDPPSGGNVPTGGGNPPGRTTAAPVQVDTLVVRMRARFSLLGDSSDIRLSDGGRHLPQLLKAKVELHIPQFNLVLNGVNGKSTAHVDAGVATSPVYRLPATAPSSTDSRSTPSSEWSMRAVCSATERMRRCALTVVTALLGHAACSGRSSTAQLEMGIASVGWKMGEAVAATLAEQKPLPPKAEPAELSCCALGLVPSECVGDRVVGAPRMAPAQIRDALGDLAERAARAVDARDMKALAQLVHPTKGLLIQHRFRFGPAEVEWLLQRTDRRDFSWEGVCGQNSQTGDVICPYGLITFAGFFDHITSRLGWGERLATPIHTTSEVGYGRMPTTDSVCNLCVVEWIMAETQQGEPYVAYHRRMEYTEGCYWDDNQVVIFMFGQHRGRWWLTGLFHHFFDG